MRSFLIALLLLLSLSSCCTCKNKQAEMDTISIPNTQQNVKLMEKAQRIALANNYSQVGWIQYADDGEIDFSVFSKKESCSKDSSEMRAEMVDLIEKLPFNKQLKATMAKSITIRKFSAEGPFHFCYLGIY